MTKPRQAIVVIHGIGEQRPMDTLRSFVEGVLGPNERVDGKQAFHSKPDPNAEGFELRRYRAFKGQTDSDFIEFYWQHHMPIAAWRFLFSWLWRLMRRPIEAMPRRFKVLWWIAWIIFVLLAIALFLSIARWLGLPVWAPPAPAKLPWLLAAAAASLGAVIRSFVGDAAIYLNPHPRTVEARNRIRAAGVAVLERLQNDGRYDRIIVVGHSLGSVIGYDILSFAWHRASEQFRKLVEEGKLPVDQPAQDALDIAETLAADRHRADFPQDWLASARALSRELKGLGFRWLVTDFVTLGSPLAHADLLLGRGPEDFQRRTEERELPTSPPFEEDGAHFSYERDGKSAAGNKQTARVPDHAAVFAVTVWQNLYFPCRFFFHGDLVGGPAGLHFRPGVKDVSVVTKVWHGWLAHTNYWTRYDGFDDEPNSAPGRLIKALDLNRETFAGKAKPVEAEEGDAANASITPEAALSALPKIEGESE
jgi:hypothetical protein